jgi:hypothetical protein
MTCSIPMPHASVTESMGICVFCGLPATDPGPCEKRPRPLETGGVLPNGKSGVILKHPADTR